MKCLKCVRSAARLRTLCDGAEECGGGDDREGPHHCVVVMAGIGIGECPRKEVPRRLLIFEQTAKMIFAPSDRIPILDQYLILSMKLFY